MRAFKVLGAALIFLVSIAVSAAPSTATADTVRIAIITDTHATEGTTDDQELYKGHLDEVLSDVNSTKVDFVLAAGDLTQDGKPQQMSDFQTQIKGFNAPVYVVAGNHDVGPKHIPGTAGGTTPERISKYEKTFGTSYWSKSLNGLRVIGLNSSLLGSGLPEEDAQWQFIEEALSQRHTEPTLIVMHYPLYIETADEAGGTYWNVEPAPRARLLSLISQNGHVLAVITGHLHRQLINRTPDGILLYTSPPVSFGLPKGKQAEGWTLITVNLKSNRIETTFKPILHLPAGAAAAVKTTNNLP
jgi:alkaline phosphatase D